MFARVTETDRARALQRPPLILSCSRRTDVPWAFLRQYLKAFHEGFMYVRSPVTRLLQRAPTCRIHTRSVYNSSDTGINLALPLCLFVALSRSSRIR